jgi:hypothetical protein
MVGTSRADGRINEEDCKAGGVGGGGEGTLVCLTLGTGLQESRRLRALVEVVCGCGVG